MSYERHHEPTTLWLQRAMVNTKLVRSYNGDDQSPHEVVITVAERRLQRAGSSATQRWLVEQGAMASADPDSNQSQEHLGSPGKPAMLTGQVSVICHVLMAYCNPLHR